LTCQNSILPHSSLLASQSESISNRVAWHNVCSDMEQLKFVRETCTSKWEHSSLIKHIMKTYWGSGGIALHILNFGTIWRGVTSFTAQPLYPIG
jgi:hypothetical protein